MCVKVPEKLCVNGDGEVGGGLTPILYLVASVWAHVKISNLEI